MAIAAFLRIAALAGVALAISSAPAQANLITNGSLEFGSGDAPNGGFVILDEGSTSITGWTVGEFGVDWDNQFWQAAEGTHSVDLNGNLGPGSLRQVISTDIGQQYLLSFALSGNPQRIFETGEPTGTVSLAVSADGTLGTFFFDVLPTQTVANMNWVEKTLKFSATSITTQIAFQSTTASNCCYGPVLDNVSVVPVPEPSAVTLIGMAVLSLFGFRRMRGRAAT